MLQTQLSNLTNLLVLNHFLNLVFIVIFPLKLAQEMITCKVKDVRGKRKKYDIFILVCLSKETTSNSQSTNYVTLNRLIL